LLEGGSLAAKRGFIALLLVGSVVQFGGVSIYYGTYYRVLGEFPLRTDFPDPLFSYKSRYVPNYSPVWGQWKMAAENWGKFLRGAKPALAIRPGSERIPLSDADVDKLRGTLDLWFAYAYYAGAPFGLCLLGFASLLGAATVMGRQLYRSCGARSP
jgi:hypothetical protein